MLIVKKQIERHLTGVQGVWVFIAADMISFFMFFMVFMYERGPQTDLFNQSSRSLDTDLGMLNTLILLTSSWLVVLAVNAARTQNRRGLMRYLVLAFIVGSGFAVNKVFEYSAKISNGVSMLTNDFYMFYYILTGLHLIHFLIGMVVLAVYWSKSAKETLNSAFIRQLETVGIYWHMVDLLWIVLFAMLYLLGVS